PPLRHTDRHGRHHAGASLPRRRAQRHPPSAAAFQRVLLQVLRVLDLGAVPRPRGAARRGVRGPPRARVRAPAPRGPGARPLRAVLPRQGGGRGRRRALHVHPVLDLHHREPLPLVRRLAPHRRDPAAVHQVRDAAAAPAPRLPRRRGPQGRPRRPRRRAAPGRRPAAAPHHPEGARDRGRRRERTGSADDGDDGGARGRRREGRGGHGPGDAGEGGGDEAGAGDGGRAAPRDDARGGGAAPPRAGRALPPRRRRAPPRRARLRAPQGRPRRQRRRRRAAGVTDAGARETITGLPACLAALLLLVSCSWGAPCSKRRMAAPARARAFVAPDVALVA
uniref:Uncharacterized protein n=1 Tax=Zea mays TaxID=4577 RepID=A0A804MZQ8_MAIZE